MLEAGRSGGNTTTVPLAAARDARELKSMEQERRSGRATLGLKHAFLMLLFTYVAFAFVMQ